MARVHAGETDPLVCLVSSQWLLWLMYNVLSAARIIGPIPPPEMINLCWYIAHILTQFFEHLSNCGSIYAFLQQDGVTLVISNISGYC